MKKKPEGISATIASGTKVLREEMELGSCPDDKLSIACYFKTKGISILDISKVLDLPLDIVENLKP